MSFWSGFGSVLTGGISNLFTSKNANGAASFLNDPLGYGARDEAAALNREQFEFQKDSWQKEFDLQNQQFDYQKWYDQNNVTLGLKQNMQAGINPLAAQGGANSSVSASASPQSPSVSPTGTANTGILGDILSQLGQNKRSELNAEVAEDEIQAKKDIAEDSLEEEKNFHQQYMNVLNKKVENESRRTSSYESDVAARVNNLVQEFNESVKSGYGRGSTKYKKLFGEIMSTISDKISGVKPEDYVKINDDGTIKPITVVPENPSSPNHMTDDEWADYYDARDRAEKSGYYLSVDEWKRSRGSSKR